MILYPFSRIIVVYSPLCSVLPEVLSLMLVPTKYGFYLLKWGLESNQKVIGYSDDIDTTIVTLNVPWQADCYCSL